jgi:hypothetical protein
MSPSDQRPHDSPPPDESRGAYTIQPLPALDGVLLYVSLNGETVGYYFGATEGEAATLLAAHLPAAVSEAANGVSS